jgi:hypothetical protein
VEALLLDSLTPSSKRRERKRERGVLSNLTKEKETMQSRLLFYERGDTYPLNLNKFYKDKIYGNNKIFVSTRDC